MKQAEQFSLEMVQSLVEHHRFPGIDFPDEFLLHERFIDMKTQNITIASPITLKCGLVLKNRIVKGAMAESFSQPVFHNPTQYHINLYDQWAKGGAAMLISGHIMIDPIHKASPGDVAIHKKSNVEMFQKYAKASTQNNTHTIVQLNHPGRQCPISVNKNPLAPSAIQVVIPGQEKFSLRAFRQPSEMTEQQIQDVIEKFASSAEFCKKVGFSGVEIHGAHGYLLSQFLSPKTNVRKDRWGGSLENRSRIIFEIIKKVRSRVGNKNFILGLKMNSADFQKGGLELEDSVKIVKRLDELEQLDFVEISGGTYENPVCSTGVKESTKQREGYFIEMSMKIQQELKNLPLMVTGGFRSKEGMQKALKDGIDLIGVAKPLCIEPDFPNKLLKDITKSAKIIDKNYQSNNHYFQHQLYLIASGQKPDVDYKPSSYSVYKHMIQDFLHSKIFYKLGNQDTFVKK